MNFNPLKIARNPYENIRKPANFKLKAYFLRIGDELYEKKNEIEDLCDVILKNQRAMK